MAIGLGRMFGFRFPENFRWPYGDQHPGFRRRWHLSLSTWFRDYLYIPLGGNRSTHSRGSIAIWSRYSFCAASGTAPAGTS
jgi:alginate O-acetyltransferase complex protein AlgI